MRWPTGLAYATPLLLNLFKICAHIWASPTRYTKATRMPAYYTPNTPRFRCLHNPGSMRAYSGWGVLVHALAHPLFLRVWVSHHPPVRPTMTSAPSPAARFIPAPPVFGSAGCTTSTVSGLRAHPRPSTPLGPLAWPVAGSIVTPGFALRYLQARYR